jgi:hypothetical protein
MTKEPELQDVMLALNALTSMLFEQQGSSTCSASRLELIESILRGRYYNPAKIDSWQKVVALVIVTAGAVMQSYIIFGSIVQLFNGYGWWAYGNALFN